MFRIMHVIIIVTPIEYQLWVSFESLPYRVLILHQASTHMTLAGPTLFNAVPTVCPITLVTPCVTVLNTAPALVHFLSLHCLELATNSNIMFDSTHSLLNVALHIAL